MKSDRKRINDYVELYDAIQEKSPSEEVAIAILREIGKDRRSRDRLDHSERALATEKQKQFMKDLGIDFPKDISRSEASVLIDENKNA